MFVQEKSAGILSLGRKQAMLDFTHERHWPYDTTLSLFHRRDRRLARMTGRRICVFVWDQIQTARLHSIRYGFIGWQVRGAHFAQTEAVKAT